MRKYTGAREQAEKLGIPFLGRVPIDPAIRVGGDTGNPIVIATPDSPQAKAFREIAAKLAAALESGGAGAAKSRIESLLQKIKRPATGK